MGNSKVYTNLNSMESLKDLTKYMNINIWESDERVYNAPKQFHITDPSNCDKLIHTVKFQEGPINEVGINGLTIESVLLITSRVLEGFQNSNFKNEYNAEALTHIYAAIESLNRRTSDRLARNVEGTYKE